MATAQTADNFYKKPDNTNNVRVDGGAQTGKKPRINNDWEYLEKPNLPNHPTTDQKFKLRYQHSGLGNVKVAKPQKTTEATDQYGNTTVNYNTKVTGQLTPTAPVIKTPRLEGRFIDSFSTEARLKKKMAVAIARVIRSVHIGYWSAVQLPLGILSIIGFGSAVATNAVINGSPDDGIIASVISSVTGTVNDIVSYVVGFGFDDVSFFLFLIPYMILSALGLIVMFGVLFFYKKSAIEPLGGKRSGLKWGLFALAFVGYLIPIANMFPWVLGWVYAVAKYPR